jgi:hypothetical protein
MDDRDLGKSNEFSSLKEPGRLRPGLEWRAKFFCPYGLGAEADRPPPPRALFKRRANLQYSSAPIFQRSNTPALQYSTDN